MEYKIGNCVKCFFNWNQVIKDKLKATLLENNIFIIIKIGKNSLGSNTFILDNTIKYKELDDSIFKKNEFHSSYLYQDKECFKMERKMERKKKLDKINENSLYK